MLERVCALWPFESFLLAGGLRGSVRRPVFQPRVRE